MLSAFLRGEAIVPGLVNRSLPLLAACILGCAGSSQTSPASGTVAAITPQDLEHRLRIIADDSMMGRASGSEGDYKTAEYVASEFRRLGLEPAGESGTYFQVVPFWTAMVDPTSQLEVDGKTLQAGRDFLPTTLAAGRRTLDGTDVIYGGSASDPAAAITPEQAADKFVVLVPSEPSFRSLRLGQ